MPKKAYYADFVCTGKELPRGAWLCVDGDMITAVQVTPPDESYERVVFAGSGIFPAYINTHTHLPMTIFRGCADDLPLDIWLKQHIWPAESRLLSPELVTDATLLAACEMIRSGTSCAVDMYFYTSEIAEVLEQSGLRGAMGFGALPPSEKYVNWREEFFRQAEVLVEKYKDNLLIEITMAPHAPYTVSPKFYRRVVDFALKYDILVQTHLLETSSENARTVEKYGMRPVEIMREAGLLDCRSLFAHCVCPNKEEIELLGRKKANISVCLQSEMKLASGMPPVKELMDAGCNVTIGTDSAASNNDLDMQKETQTFGLMNKVLTGDPAAFSAETVLGCATENAATLLSRAKTGKLEAGYAADFMVVSYNAPHMMPVYNPVSHLVYSANKDDITDFFVAGRQLMKNKNLITIDENAVLDKARKWSK